MLISRGANRVLTPHSGPVDRVDFIAVASRDEVRAESYLRESAIERAYASYAALLDDPDVEANYNSLPNSLHVGVDAARTRGREARRLMLAVENTPEATLIPSPVETAGRLPLRAPARARHALLRS